MDSGSASIFYPGYGLPDVWGQLKKITGTDTEAGDNFGWSVSIHGDTAVVGAPFDDDYDQNSGAAYIFDRNKGWADEWGQVQKITASDGAAGDFFGVSVSIHGDTVVVGARWDNDKGEDSGSAYIFYRNQGGPDNWGQVKKITASDGAAEDYFGSSVSVFWGAVAVGARLDDEKGSVYIFYNAKGGTDNWGEAQKITASDGAAGDGFGTSVSIFGSLLVVGAPFDDDAKGSAYIFFTWFGSDWNELEKISATDVDVNEGFGAPVDSGASTLTVVVGAPWDDVNGASSGSSYVFSLGTTADEDGIENVIDTLPNEYSNDFRDAAATFGTIIDRADQKVMVTDEPDPLGVRIKTEGGERPATVSVCGVSVIDNLIDGREIVETCGGSVEIEVFTGPVDLRLFADDGRLGTTSLDTGNSLIFEPTTFTVTAPPTNTEDVVVVIEGKEFYLTPGETKTIVDIDIRPFSRHNIVIPWSWGLIPVAILSTPNFNAPSEVDKTSLTFGPTGDEQSKAFCLRRSKDVNHDGSRDLFCFFRTKLTGFQIGDKEGILRGKTNGDNPIEGRDSVKIKAKKLWPFKHKR